MRKAKRNVAEREEGARVKNILPVKAEQKRQKERDF